MTYPVTFMVVLAGIHLFTYLIAIIGLPVVFVVIGVDVGPPSNVSVVLFSTGWGVTAHILVADHVAQFQI